MLIDFIRQADQLGVDRVTFLLQNKGTWQGKDPEIYKFLYKNNPQNKEILDVIQETYLSADTRTNVIKVITDILGDILSESTDPDLCMYAKQLLIKKSQPCKEKYSLDYLYRLRAFAKLTSCMNDHEVQELIHNVLENDAKYQMKIAALNGLDGLDKLEVSRDSIIIKNILNGLFEKEVLTQDDLYKIEWIMWTFPKESKSAWQELESAQIDRLLKLFQESVQNSSLYAGMQGGNGYTPLSIFTSSISYSAPLYSILKFIGYHTTDKITYEKIISNIPPLVKEQEEKRGIGLLTKSNAFLKEIMQNPAFNPEFPKWDHNNSESAFTPRPDFSKEVSYFHDVRQSLLLQTLSDEKQDQSTRTVAMRMLCSDYGHDKLMLKNLLQQTQGYSEHFSQEAQRLIGWIAPSMLAHTLEQHDHTSSAYKF